MMSLDRAAVKLATPWMKSLDLIGLACIQSTSKMDQDSINKDRTRKCSIPGSSQQTNRK
jgi:hypothetical protein